MAKEELARKPRRASAVDPAARAAFVGRGEAVDRETEGKGADDKPRGRGLVERKRTGADVRRLTVYIRPDTAKALARRAVDEGRDMSKLVQDALDRFLR